MAYVNWCTNKRSVITHSLKNVFTGHDIHSQSDRSDRVCELFSTEVYYFFECLNFCLIIPASKTQYTKRTVALSVP